MERLKAQPRALSILYYDSKTSPCACFADGIALATTASVGQRTVTIARESAPEGAAAVIVIKPRQGGQGLKFTIPLTALGKLKTMNDTLDPRERYEAVMTADDLYQVEAAQ